MIMNFTSTDSIPERAYQLLDDIGIPAHIKGYSYIAYAMRLAVDNPDILEQMTKQMYPLVAREFGTTGSRVERAIRHAIEVAFDRASDSTIKKYFGNSVDPIRGKATNSQFIATFSRILRRESITQEAN